MKAPKKGKDKKKVNKKGAVTKTKPKKEQVLVVAQEIKYARLLSGNEKNTRDRVLKALKKWLTNCFEKGYEFKEDDFSRIWKGLFYAVWMSDKPLIQEELCESIAGILDLFPPSQLKATLLMTKAGFKTLATEWYGIDQHRMDKFLMLVRRYLRGSLRCLNRCEWSLDSCQRYATMLSAGDGLFVPQTPHYARNATSMLMHFMDCFLEELAKVSEGSISKESLAALIHPFTTYTCLGELPALCTASRRLLTALLRQSEPALQYADKTRAWQRMGCPGDGPDALELASDDEEQNQDLGDNSDEELDESSRGALDPRAGRVDVSLPLLPVPAAELADALRSLLPRSASRAHKRVKICLQRFEKLAAGENPLPVSVRESNSAPVVKPKRSVRALRALEAKIKSDTDELKLRGLSRKHRKRLLKKTRSGISIVEEVDTLHKHKNITKNGEWLVESTDQSENDTSNKENQNKPKKNKDKVKKRKLEIQNGDVGNKKVKLDEKKGKRVIKESTSKDVPSRESTESPKKESTSKDVPSRESTESPKKDVKVKEVKLNGKIKDTNKIQKEKKVEKESPKKDKNKSPESPKLMINKLKHYQKSLQKEKREKSFQKETKIQKETKTHKETNLTKNLQKELKNVTKDTKDRKDLAKDTKSENKLTKKLEKQTKSFQEATQNDFETPKKVKFVLKNNSMQKPVDYYKSVRQSPSIPFDGSKKPNKTNLKPSTPSPINPFFKKKNRIKH